MLFQEIINENHSTAGEIEMTGHILRHRGLVALVTEVFAEFKVRQGRSRLRYVE